MSISVLLLVNGFTRGGGAERLAIDLVTANLPGIHFVACSIGDARSDEAHAIRSELESHGAETVVIGEVNRIARVKAIIDVVRRHRVDLAHLHALSLAALPLLPLRLPYIYTFHAETLVGPYRRAFQILEVILARHAHRCIAVSHAMRAVAMRRTRLRERDVVVIPNGVDVKRLTAQVPRAEVRARFGIPGDAQLVTVLARVDRNKRQDLVLEAIARLERPVHTVLAGSLSADREWVERLRARVIEMGIAGRVALPGVVDDAASLLAASDALVAASDSESFGIAPVEAMIMRVPVVASDIPAHRESSAGGKNVLLFPPGDVAALASALERVLARDRSPDLDRISNEAIAAYGFDRVALEHAQLYREVAAEGERR